MARPTIPVEQRFAEKYRVDPSGCWVWTASLMANGYSQFRYKTGKNGYGHRFAYEHFVGPIPEGSQLHHTCENTACVNPDHLVAVTAREHVLELTDGEAARNSRKTHCKRGHPLDGGNVYVNPKTGRRACRTCTKDWREDHQDQIRDYQRDYQRQYQADRYANDPEYREQVKARQRAYTARRRARAAKP